MIEALKSRPLTRDEKHGTRVTVWPNPKYFDSPNIPQQELQHLLRLKAILLPGVKVTLNNLKKVKARPGNTSQGLRGYLTESLAQTSNSEILIPLFEGEHYAAAENEGFSEGEGAAWVVAWTEDGSVVRESYVNLIPTTAGGTHELELSDGLFNAGVLSKCIRCCPKAEAASPKMCLHALRSCCRPRCSTRNFRDRSRND